MVSLWGTKKDGDEEQNAPLLRDDAATSSSTPRRSEADERTRLLPAQAAPPGPEGYLSPDDPAVSPYNLWSVRFMRYFTVLFAIITFLWWVLLLVSIFVSPPGMHARGSGFFDFSYTTLTEGLLLVVLLFFANPSKAAQVTCLVLAVILLVDTILIVSVPQLRFEEGWVGIASVVWALLMSIWTIITERVVAFGKKEEEERLTGREETRRTLGEWVGVLFSTIVLVILAIVVVLMSCTLVLRARDASLEVPGERYFVDGFKYRIHLFCAGSEMNEFGVKNPTVLFEAGEETFEHTLLPFADAALKNGSIQRYCYADRPGFAWSDNAPSPFSAGSATDALSEALARAGETGPWVLASAGIGSIYQRVFSSRHGSDVKGLLLIDPLHEDLLHNLQSPALGFSLWFKGIISPLGLSRTPAAIFKGRTREDRVYGRSAYLGGKYIKAKLQESLVADSLTKKEVSAARTIQDKSTPLVVISSGIEVKRSQVWETKQRDLTRLTDALGAWKVVNKAPHQVWRTLDGREAIESELKKLMDFGHKRES